MLNRQDPTSHSSRLTRAACAVASAGVPWQAMTSARYVLPSLWLALVLLLGTEYFSPYYTGTFVLPFLKALASGESSARLRTRHEVLRKLEQVAAYYVFVLL